MGLILTFEVKQFILFLRLGSKSPARKAVQAHPPTDRQTSTTHRTREATRPSSIF
ncbi:hypothetical protein PGT21_003968 [Puccinia graminis f. sp. tritici]|uniref:Uncharacterized protein n=1 Tax=Puccinia graminis f. sp. tritici TaxID=56615 RepID=A0A5B0NZM3_PUCGR|nr:hypothetical protein PGTUg99_036309 [Puccinia graminis f. sp. tritici]KAA1093944.1 hypothetical protein PGT21_003968 [Puccinia graminis f. sp. tritici]